MIAWIKVLLAVFAIFSAGSDDDYSPDRSGPLTRIDVGRTLDLLFCGALCWFVAKSLGAFRMQELQASGYDAIVPLFGALLWLGLKVLLFVALPTALICLFLRSFESLTPRLVVYGVFVLIGAGAHWQSGRAAAAEASRQAEIRAVEEQERQQLQREAESMEQARVTAEQNEKQELRDTREKLIALARQNEARWIEDVRAGGKAGYEGDPPPMLAIAEAGRYRTRITNLAPQKICAKLVRAIRQQRADDYLRCAADYTQPCDEIPSGGHAVITVFADSSNAACENGQYEYRIGSPLQPEPSWWSLSALADLRQHPTDYRETFEKLTLMDLKNEVARLEKMLAETDRAARWKRESGGQAPAAGVTPE